MILAELKEKTRKQHVRLENKMEVMNDSFTREDYKKLLGRFYGYYLPLDEKIISAIKKENVDFDYKSRLKVPQLEKDLKTLGMSGEEISNLPVCKFTPEIDSAQNVFGCLYVVEGSTLGGQLISRHLAESLNVQPGSGSSFFSGYGKQTGIKWKEFGRKITEFTEKNGSEKEIISAAIETFETLENWLFEKT